MTEKPEQQGARLRQPYAGVIKDTYRDLWTTVLVAVAFGAGTTVVMIRFWAGTRLGRALSGFPFPSPAWNLRVAVVVGALIFGMLCLVFLVGVIAYLVDRAFRLALAHGPVFAPERSL